MDEEEGSGVQQPQQVEHSNGEEKKEEQPTSNSQSSELDSTKEKLQDKNKEQPSSNTQSSELDSTKEEKLNKEQPSSNTQSSEIAFSDDINKTMEEKDEQPSTSSQLSTIASNEDDKLQEKDDHPSSNAQSPKVDELRESKEQQPSSHPQSSEVEESKKLIEASNSLASDDTDVADDPLPAMVSEDAPSFIIPPTNVGEVSPPSLVVAEDAPSVDAEDAPSLVAEDNVNEEAPPMTTEMVSDNPPLIVAKGPQSLIAKEADDGDTPSSMIVEDTPSMVVEGLLAEEIISEAAKEVPNMVAEEAILKVEVGSTPGFAEEATTIVANEALLKISEGVPMAAEDASPMAAEDTSPVVLDGIISPVVLDGIASPMVDGNASSIAAEGIIDEHGSSMATDEVEHAPEVDTGMEMEAEEAVETGRGSGKRKRGRPAKVQAKTPPPRRTEPRRTEEEDVCFICFDGGNLVLCDRRGCPKAYHPICVNRDEAFFRSKGRWNCGWHICSNCEKAAHYMCYTCTYSLCKGCIKEAEFFCVRGNKGLCETCMRTVILIEKNEQAQVNFDDKSSWEYLFKEYWIDLKGKLSLTPDELNQAKNPMKGSNTLASKGESSEELYDVNDDRGSDSDGSSGHLEVVSSKKKKAKRRSKSSKEAESPSVTNVGASLSNDPEWASKDLLEFVAHMKNGDKSVQSPFDVQALLLDYIKLNNLRDPRRKSQIVCDSRLENLFGKARVGHFEMLKLLESHFLIKEDTHADDTHGATTDTEADQLDGDGSGGSSTKSDKRRKSRKKGDGRGPQTNLDDYAAIDVHNIKLLYLRRNLMEDLLEESEFHNKVVGSFVRIRISGTVQKHDMYRLVQVVGTRKAAEPYKTGKRSADVVLEILNLSKPDAISIDTISNQDFTEDECKRLRQSIKCGLISRMTVGEVQEKAMTLQAVRVNDWLETEKLRISHLRDRASEQGRRKDLRECVEKLQLLNTPEERLRRLQEIPEVHADPNMDPNYESEEDEAQDDRSQDKSTMSRDAGFSRKGRDPISPNKGSPITVDTWSGARKSATPISESGRNISKIDVWDRGQGASGGSHHLETWEKPKNLGSATGLGTSASSVQAVGPSPGNSQEPATALPTDLSSNISEADKVWHYQDPSGKVQGPFSMVQLRKWSTTGHFPADLRIWQTTAKQEDSILLNDALVGKYNKELPQKDNSTTPEKAVAFSENNREVNWGRGWEVNTNAAWTDKNQSGRTPNSNWKGASGWEGGTNTAWTENNQIDTTSNSNWKHTSGIANNTTQLVNSDVWGSGMSSWASPTTDSRGDHSGHSFRGGRDSRSNNSWAGRFGHSPHSPSPYSGHPQRPISHQGGQRGGRWNRGHDRGNTWNSNRYRGQQFNRGRGYDKRDNNMGPSGHSPGHNWRAPPEMSTKGWSSVETPKSVTEAWDFNHSNRNNLSNLPSPTPTSNTNWRGQASENMWSPTPVSNFPVAATTPRPGSNGVQSSPVGMAHPNNVASGWTEQQQHQQQHLSVTSPPGGWGPNNTGSISVPKPAEPFNQDGGVDYSSPPTPTPTPTPVSAAAHQHT